MISVENSATLERMPVGLCWSFYLEVVGTLERPCAPIAFDGFRILVWLVLRVVDTCSRHRLSAR